MGIPAPLGLPALLDPLRPFLDPLDRLGQLLVIPERPDPLEILQILDPLDLKEIPEIQVSLEQLQVTLGQRDLLGQPGYPEPLAKLDRPEPP
jgi:hypothetical protein